MEFALATPIISRLMGRSAKESRIARMFTTARLGTRWCARYRTILTGTRSVFVTKGVAVERGNAGWHGVECGVHEMYLIVPGPQFGGGG